MRAGGIPLGVTLLTAACALPMGGPVRRPGPAERSGSPAVADEHPPGTLSAFETEVVRQVNARRAGSGLQPLATSRGLVALAREHSEDMARRRYFDHRTPEGMGAAERVREGGILYRKLAENIGMNSGMEDPVRSAVSAWMASPGHRASILDPDFSRTGVGVAEDEDGALFFTQLFLQPPPQAP